MAAERPLLSICIPAYQRARFLGPLLDSILQQPGSDFEIVIAEDDSPERTQIRAIAAAYAGRSPVPLRYFDNERNLGYDGNIRRLVELARGRYCFFMGNDDLMAPGALQATRQYLSRYPDTGMLLRGYSWFFGKPGNIVGTVRYVSEPLLLPAGAEAVTMGYRRSGVISGYVVLRDPAQYAATARFDGTLYYQMHLSAAVLARAPVLVVPDVLILSRADTPPDFGGAAHERGRYTPGYYTPQARVSMLKGAMDILDAHPELVADGSRERVVRDYARHFYPFVMDQLGLPLKDYLRMCREMARTPVGRYPSFYLNCTLPWLLGRRNCDRVIGWVRSRLGRTPRF